MGVLKGAWRTRCGKERTFKNNHIFVASGKNVVVLIFNESSLMLLTGWWEAT